MGFLEGLSLSGATGGAYVAESMAPEEGVVRIPFEIAGGIAPQLVFGSVVKNRANATIDKIAKKDKTFAKNYATLKKLRNKVERDLKARGVDLDDEVDDIVAKFKKLKR